MNALSFPLFSLASALTDGVKVFSAHHTRLPRSCGRQTADKLRFGCFSCFLPVDWKCEHSASVCELLWKPRCSVVVLNVQRFLSNGAKSPREVREAARRGGGWRRLGECSRLTSEDPLFLAGVRSGKALTPAGSPAPLQLD